ncbi:hypothetical protein V6N11_028043 [Hibiscus sabdariffa]|uniref:Uncharacterized protein n=2 Tax=Hibiscus sabdariffa TaxID=183260 RepID=A0ABR2AIK1_9ROSI
MSSKSVSMSESLHASYVYKHYCSLCYNFAHGSLRLGSDPSGVEKSSANELITLKIKSLFVALKIWP